MPGSLRDRLSSPAGYTGRRCETVTSSVIIRFLYVRHRPNAASGGWSYGRDLRHCREKGNTLFETTLKFAWLLYFDLDC